MSTTPSITFRLRLFLCADDDNTRCQARNIRVIWLPLKALERLYPDRVPGDLRFGGEGVRLFGWDFVVHIFVEGRNVAKCNIEQRKSLQVRVTDVGADQTALFPEIKQYTNDGDWGPKPVDPRGHLDHQGYLIKQLVKLHADKRSGMYVWAKRDLIVQVTGSVKGDPLVHKWGYRFKNYPGPGFAVSDHPAGPFDLKTARGELGGWYGVENVPEAFGGPKRKTY